MFFYALNMFSFAWIALFWIFCRGLHATGNSAMLAARLRQVIGVLSGHVFCMF